MILFLGKKRCSLRVGHPDYSRNAEVGSLQPTPSLFIIMRNPPRGIGKPLDIALALLRRKGIWIIIVTKKGKPKTGSQTGKIPTALIRAAGFL